MLKGLTRLWLKSAKQLDRAQQRQRKKLIKNLLATPPPAKKPRVAKLRQPPAKPKTDLITAPGRWTLSYYRSPAAPMLSSRRLSYYLYLPQQPHPAPLPLIVMLHGCKQNATQFAQGTRMNLLAEKKGFAVLYPQQSVLAHADRCWHWYDKITQDGNAVAGTIAALIAQTVQSHAFDPTRVYIAGLSAGAGMAGIVALRYPHLIAAAGLHSGPVFGAGHSRIGAYAVMQTGDTRHAVGPALQSVLEKFATFPVMPAILIHGKRDKIVRPVNLTHLSQQFRAVNGHALTNDIPVVTDHPERSGRNPRHAYTIHDYSSDRKILLRVCEIAGLEHAWSGGDCTLPFNSCAGPDASRMMWEFFARHRRIQ